MLNLHLHDSLGGADENALGATFTWGRCGIRNLMGRILPKYFQFALLGCKADTVRAQFWIALLIVYISLRLRHRGFPPRIHNSL